MRDEAALLSRLDEFLNSNLLAVDNGGFLGTAVVDGFTVLLFVFFGFCCFLGHGPLINPLGRCRAILFR